MATLSDLITDALLDLGVRGAGETPDAAESALGLRRINRLINKWRTENLLIPQIVRATATLTASQASFTVGSGGNINIVRPSLQQVAAVNYIDTDTDPDQEISLGPLMTEAEYQAVPQKALTAARPTRAYYTPTYASSTGTLYPFPIPTDSGLTWAFYYHAPIAVFTAISDTVTLPDACEQMIVKALAVEMAPSFRLQPDPILLRDAANAMAAVKRSNQRPVELSFEMGALVHGGWFDVNTGE